jgi:hypothetical protein
MGPPPGMMGPPPGMMGPPPGMMGPPPGMGGPPPGMMGPPPGMMGPPPMGGMPMGMQRPGTDQVRPLQAPPYLASQTAARMDAPVEPWAGSIKLIGLIFGILLVVCFCVPWAVGGGKTIFSWTAFGHQSSFMKVSAFMLVGTGALAILLSLLPLATLGRGLGIAALGLVPILWGMFGPKITDSGGLPKWDKIVMLLATLTLVSGLLVRSQYRSSIAGRLMATIGALGVIAIYLIPSSVTHDKVLLVEAFKAFGDAEGKLLLVPILTLIPFLLALLSLLVWLPASTSAGAGVIAWFWIPLALVLGLALWAVMAHEPTDELKAGLAKLFWQPIAMMSWTAFVGYGIATAIGKNLEHS